MKNNVPAGQDYIDEIMKYEKEVLLKDKNLLKRILATFVDFDRTSFVDERKW